MPAGVPVCGESGLHMNTCPSLGRRATCTNLAVRVLQGEFLSPGVGGDMRVSPAVKAEGGVDRVRREGILCKRGDRWLKKWVDRRVLLQSGILSYFKVFISAQGEREC